MQASIESIKKLFEEPFSKLTKKAIKIHEESFPENDIELATLLSIKTGGCPEDCSYCSQSSKYETGSEVTKLMDVDLIMTQAKEAKENGAARFCMGAAWRSLKDRDVDQITEIITSVKSLGMETCMTLGMLTSPQAKKLKAAGLDYYNHNIDTSEDYYSKIISTRTFEDRIDTLKEVQNAGIKVCCGGILGMGESREDRVKFLHTLANLDPYPESVPLNKLVPIKGTPLEGTTQIDDIEFIKTIAIARILMPKARIRLSAGRKTLSEASQALCFMVGANSIFYGEKLLTTANSDYMADMKMIKNLGLQVRLN